MYAVIRYFLQDTKASFEILKLFKSGSLAGKFAFQCAKDLFGGQVEEGLAMDFAHGNVTPVFTTNDGNLEVVFTITRLPDYEETASDHTDTEDKPLEIVQAKNGKYEWGFDLTDFLVNEDAEQGAVNFQQLLDKYEMTFIRNDNGFIWENKDGSISLKTGNNPITGEYYYESPAMVKRCRKGELSHVGVSCDSETVLKEFIQEFRNRAGFIKDESNRRDFI